jgi:hypothetical protein
VSEVVAIVEGQTEQAFVNNQLRLHLNQRGLDIWPVLPGRSRRRGGVKEWDVARDDIIRTLNERRYCTTMFDFYGMPASWPGRKGAAKKGLSDRATRVETQMVADVGAAMAARGKKFDVRLFIPYVQLHEFEALVFADVTELVGVMAPLSGRRPDALARKFQEIVSDAGEPEAIDDGRETCPSRRIHKIVRAYRKRVHGPIVTQRIGIAVLRERCRHFGEWIGRLESITPRRQGPRVRS